jgi:hypothetical protein
MRIFRMRIIGTSIESHLSRGYYVASMVFGGVAAGGARCGPATWTVRRLRAPDFPGKSGLRPAKEDTAQRRARRRAVQARNQGPSPAGRSRRRSEATQRSDASLAYVHMLAPFVRAECLAAQRANTQRVTARVPAGPVCRGSPAREAAGPTSRGPAPHAARRGAPGKRERALFAPSLGPRLRGDDGFARLRGMTPCAGTTRRSYCTAICRAVTTGFFLPSVSVSTPFSSLALVASASIASGSS